MKVLMTGSAGFIAGYLVQELLDLGHSVVGVDNFSKYGPMWPANLGHPAYLFTQGDATNVELLHELMRDVDHVVARQHGGSTEPENLLPIVTPEKMTVSMK